MKRAPLITASLLLTLACDGDKVTTPATPFVPTSTGVSISPPVQTIPPGQTAQLTATARYSDGSTKDVTSQATWTSSQTNVATVSAGAVRGVAPGRTEIRVLFERWATHLTMVIKPDGTFILRGGVTEPVGVGVSGATVEVISGPPNQAITNSVGGYELFGVVGTFIVRVGKAGYFDERRTVTMSADQWLFVEITPRSAPAAVAGTYGVTFTVSPSCTILPAELKTRTYTARIDQEAARLLITLSDASFVPMKNTFSGRVADNTVTFDLGGKGFYYYSVYYGTAVQEVLPSGQILGVFGTMSAPAPAQSFSGMLVGGFTLQTGNSHTSCAATDNQVVFTRH